jgi:phosphoglycerate kinase
MRIADLPHINAYEKDLKGVYVFLRISLNVPIEEGRVTNTFRITQGLSTVNYLVQRGARVILASHLGDQSASLAPVHAVLAKHLHITLSPEVTGEQTTFLRDTLHDGEVLLLENLRRDPREKANDDGFAQELAALADVYVNDDFAASHRQHASLHAICSHLPSYVGELFAREYRALSLVAQPQHPSLFILGGAKFDTKMPLVEKYLELYDHIFIGGALANDIFKAQGHNVGISLVSDMDLSHSPLLSHPKLLVPVDVIVQKDDVRRVTTPDDVREDEAIFDAGPQTLAMLDPYIKEARTILWNGPLGNYERGYQDQTCLLARKIAAAKGNSVVGGGDTIASIESLGLKGSFGFLSTAGGAMLTYLELGTLPALEAVRASKRS